MGLIYHILYEFVFMVYKWLWLLCIIYYIKSIKQVFLTDVYFIVEPNY
jgi:hypothetical protein